MAEKTDCNPVLRILMYSWGLEPKWVMLIIEIATVLGLVVGGESEYPSWYWWAMLLFLVFCLVWVARYVAFVINSLAKSRWRVPTFWFYGFLLIPSLLYLDSASLPGMNFFNVLIASAFYLGAFVVWVVWILGCIGFSISNKRLRVNALWFLVAPLGGALLLGIVFTNLPLAARFAVSRPAMDELVDQPSRDDDYGQRVGLYRVGFVQREKGAVIIYERTGNLGDDAGFAYLPDGPSPELDGNDSEPVYFHHIQGDWYSWTASW